MRVAIVHHWFVTRGGGERVAECIKSLFPTAELFTLAMRPDAFPSGLLNRRLHTSFLQTLPFATTHHRHLLPLYPSSTEGLNLRGFDLVISSDSGPVKGVRLDPGAIHICYCHTLGRKLRIAGSGPEEARLRRIAGPHVEFLGKLSDDRLWQQYAESRSLLFTAEEDFGMVPLEAQAWGRPVIAQGAGGSLETVREGKTGVYFPQQTVVSLMDGIRRFEAALDNWEPEHARRWAHTFSTPVFLERVRRFILERVPRSAEVMEAG